MLGISDCTISKLMYLNSRNINKRVSVTGVIFKAIFNLKNERGVNQRNSYQSNLTAFVKKYLYFGLLCITIKRP